MLGNSSGYGIGYKLTLTVFTPITLPTLKCAIFDYILRLAVFTVH